MSFILILSLFFNLSFSQIWVQNGNFSKAFIDGKISEDFDLFRIYNSFSNVKGIFGYGWGSDFETKLSSYSGIVSIEETPGGKKVLYVPENKETLDDLVNSVAVSSTKERQSDDFYKKLKQELKDNISLLISLAQKNNVKGALKKGTVLISFDGNYGKIKVLNNGYIRKTAEGSLQEFNSKGLLIRVKKGNLSYRYVYDYKGRLSKVITSKGDNIVFRFNENDYVEKVIYSNNKVSTYKYDDKGNLTESISVDGDKYSYEYDSRHKMVGLSYYSKNTEDIKKWQMKYDTKTGRIIFEEDPRGFKTYLEYVETENEKGSYKSVEVVKRKESSVSSELYEYWRKRSKEGNLYTYKIKEQKKNYKREIIYNEYQKPISFNTNGKITYYKYDGSRLKEKIFPDGRVIKLMYDSRDRITTLKNNDEVFKFKYNNKNQIVYAENEGLKFKIFYNSKDKIYKIIDDKKHQLTFLYNANGKLLKINSLRYGSLDVNRDLNTNSFENAKENSKKIRKLYKRYTDVLMIFSLIGRV